MTFAKQEYEDAEIFNRLLGQGADVNVYGWLIADIRVIAEQTISSTFLLVYVNACVV